MQEMLLVQVSGSHYHRFSELDDSILILYQIVNRRLNVCCLLFIGDYGIDLKQHPQAQLISDAAGLGDVPERFVGSR